MQQHDGGQVQAGQADSVVWRTARLIDTILFFLVVLFYLQGSSCCNLRAKLQTFARRGASIKYWLAESESNISLTNTHFSWRERVHFQNDNLVVCSLLQQKHVCCLVFKGEKYRVWRVHKRQRSQYFLAYVQALLCFTSLQGFANSTWWNETRYNCSKLKRSWNPSCARQHGICVVRLL